MTRAADRLTRLTSVLLPAVVLTLGCGVSLLPWNAVVQVLDVCLAWLTLSLPIAVTFGHCVLDEGE